MKKPISVSRLWSSIILNFILTMSLITGLTGICSAQRFIIDNKEDTMDNLKKGDSSYFSHDYNASVSFYQKFNNKVFDENAMLNQIQNHIGAKDIDGALQITKNLSDRGFYKFWILDNDEIYRSLIENKAYGKVNQKIQDNFQNFVQKEGVRSLETTAKIMLMSYRDQYYQWVGSFKQRFPTAYPKLTDKKLDSLKLETFKNNVRSLKEIFAKDGYLWYDQIGKSATHHVWLMIQHADDDLPFQKSYLNELQHAVKNNNASGLDLAYLTDRVRKNEGAKQVYGTQMSYKLVEGPDKQKVSKMELYPVENLADLDKRRKEVGLMPIDEYFELMKRLTNRK